MPSVQDGLKSRNIAKSSREAGSTPLADDNVHPPPTRKRKYQKGENGSNLWDSFTIKQPQQDHAQVTYVFTPRLLLPRIRLPLAYLDPCGTTGFDQGTRLFSARIPALETACREHGVDTLPHVLITESSSKSLYAIERVQPGIYAQCKLAGWIELEHLEVLRNSDPHNATSQKRPRLGKTEQRRPGIASHKARDGSPSMVHSTASSCHRAKCDLRKPGYISTNPISFLKDVSPAGPSEPPPAVTKSCKSIPLQEFTPSANEQGLQNPDDLLKSVKTQYMDLLYKSKASLAYFAKGPLSRARAGFSDDAGGPASRRRLVDHLRALIVPMNLLDKKYREALPCLVKDLPSGDLSDDERDEVVAKYKKLIRKSKKEKIGKNGLYPEENLDVLSWWLDYIASVPAYHSSELMIEATNAKIIEQKTRETFLQIILVLEVLALESTHPKFAVERGLDEEPGQSDLPVMKRKAKRPQDISLLLDLYVDRLCIWQSMAVEKDDSSKMTADEGRASSVHDSSNKKQDINRLREFYIDVVLPFYTARLPVLSRSLCKKLGGPLSRSPARPALKRVGSSSLKPSKPGAAMKRAQPRQAGRTLERVLTDDRTSQKPAPQLFRSATDSAVPSLKREPSEMSLSNVPVARPTLHHSKRYSQREVDLTAVSQAKEAKMKKAELEQELQGVIATLKRPNPRMAVKEFVESAERRATGAKTRKPKHPVRNPFAQSVQIMATPSANRRRDVYATQATQAQKSTVISEEVEEIPPSSCIRVPASSIKPLPDPQAKTNSTRARECLMSTVEQTPTRGPSKLSRSNIRFSANTNPRKQVIMATPSSAMAAGRLISVLNTSGKAAYQLPATHLGVEETPSRRSSTGPKGGLPRSSIEDSPVAPLKTVSANVIGTSTSLTSSPIPKGDVSIYESLGWDDDVDELM
ncbi:MAG: hypothetical protein Q9178_004094 [Gyalolechia marmorata]